MRVEIENLSHIYNQGRPDETAALDNVNLTIEDGEFAAIIGHTGSGKSTLVQHINALLRPTSGRIIIGDTDITEPGISLMDIRKKVGLVFQYPEYQLFEENVALDVAFGPRNLGLSEDETAKRVDEALQLVGLDPELMKVRSPFELSGGQKRRAAVAGVIAMKPDVLILDEPTAGLDPKAHDEILDMVCHIREEQKCTIIFVSHNMDDVARLCDRVIVMNKGRVELNGTPEEVFSQDRRLKEIGLGLPAARELLYQLKLRGIDIEKAGVSGMSERPLLTEQQAADAIAAELRRIKSLQQDRRK